MKIQWLAKLLSVNCYSQYLRQLWWRYVLPKQIKRLGVNAASSVRFHGMPIISLVYESKIEIGENSVICSNPTMTALGVNQPVVLRTLRPGAAIIIGNNTGISGGAICAATHVEIGNDCLLGANVTIVDTDFHALNPIGRRTNNNPLEIGAEPIIVEDNVFIGTGSIVLKGVRVGKNSVIGAGSVVTKDVPPDSIVAGNPAKLMRRL
jgi:acetyltransferase-like isoleucine patch superfamily enzyme